MKSILGLAVCLLIAPMLWAAGGDEPHSAKLKCAEIQPLNTPNFLELAEATAELDRQLCKSFLAPFPDISEAERLRALREFIDLAEIKARRIGKVLPLNDLSEPFSDLRRTIDTGDINRLSLPTLTVARKDFHTYQVSFNDPAHDMTFQRDDNEKCQQGFGKTCLALFDEYAAALNQYKNSYKKLTTDEAIGTLKRLSANWREFLSEARAQTTLDLIVTTRWQSKHFQKDYLVGPPSKQYFFFHPSLVYEHLAKAPDGFQTEPGIALELVGINWWEKGNSPLYYPFGASFTTTFIDRPVTDDFGWGLMVHVDNRFSIGWANYGGDDSIYVSADLLNLFNDKRKLFSEYRDVMVD